MSEVIDLLPAAAPAEILKLDPQTYAAAVYAPYRQALETIKAQAATVSYDISTTAGMKTAITWRARFRDLRVAAEKARKERKAPVLELGKLLDSRYKELEAELVPFEDRFDADIKAREAEIEAQRAAREAAERTRIEALQQKVAGFGRIAAALVGAASEEIHAAHQQLETREITLEEFGEFAGQAQQAKADALDRLSDLFSKAVAHEQEQARIAAERAELERLKAEQAERERVAAADRAEAEKAARAAREAEEAAAKAQREAEEAERRREREAHEAEMKRQRDELAAQQAEVARQQREIREAQEKAQREAQEREAAEARRLQAIADEAVAREREAAAAEACRQAEIKAARRPSDEELMSAISIAFSDRAPAPSEVIDWIAGFDVEDARSRLLARAA